MTSKKATCLRFQAALTGIIGWMAREKHLVYAQYR